MKKTRTPPSPAYQSPLQGHYEEIRSLRRARKTWREITEIMRQKYGITLTLQAVQSFFAAASKRGGRQPLGFEDPVPPSPPAAPPASNPVPASPPSPTLTSDYDLDPEAEPELTPLQRKKRMQQ